MCQCRLFRKLPFHSKVSSRVGSYDGSEIAWWREKRGWTLPRDMSKQSPKCSGSLLLRLGPRRLVPIPFSHRVVRSSWYRPHCGQPRGLRPFSLEPLPYYLRIRHLSQPQLFVLGATSSSRHAGESVLKRGDMLLSTLFGIRGKGEIVS